MHAIAERAIAAVFFPLRQLLRGSCHDDLYFQAVFRLVRRRAVGSGFCTEEAMSNN